MERLKGTIVTAEHRGETVRFFVTRPRDVIQRHHVRGEFYEAEELALIADHLAPGATFVDVGANVGNHVVYVARFLRPRRVIAFEALPPAIALLRINVALNGIDGAVDLGRLGCGLSDAQGRAELVTTRGNLGGTRLRAHASGAVPLVTGDEALAGEAVDFVKIDVEGMEMRVLAGLARTIAASRPILFVEVDDDNLPAFRDWLEANRYAVRARFRRYRTNENYLVSSAAGGAGGAEG